MITITDVCDHLVSCAPKLLQPPQKDDYLRDIYFLTINDLGILLYYIWELHLLFFQS